MAPETRTLSYNGNDLLVVPAERGQFTELQQWISDIAAELNIQERIKKQLLISCDEIFTNIASYAYPDGNGTIAVAVEFISETQYLRIIFSDSGTAFNPLEISATS